MADSPIPIPIGSPSGEDGNIIDDQITSTNEATRNRPDWSTEHLVSPDVTCRSLWSPHTSLVSGDTVDMTGIEGDALDGQASWEQSMGLGWPIVAPQHRINP